MVDGLTKVKPLVAKTAALNMPALAITDQTNFCGLVKFYGAAHGAGVKPIIGADFWVQSELLGDQQFRLTALAMDAVGYKNITELISKAYLRGHVKGRAVIDQSWLIEHQQGVILLSGAKDGDLGKMLLKGNQLVVNEITAFYKTHFPDRYYLELIRTNRVDEENYLHLALDIAAQYQLPVVATNEVVFADKDFLMRMIFEFALTKVMRWVMKVDLKIIVLNSIYVVKKKCVNSFLIFLRHYKIVLK